MDAKHETTCASASIVTVMVTLERTIYLTVAFATLTLGLLGCGAWPDPEDAAKASADHRSSPAPARVVLVGFDGLDWGLLDRLIADGRCPTFARMKSEGAWANLVSYQPVLSPLIWTSIATGRRPEVHGVLDFVVTDPDTGSDVPISNRFREVHAFWNVLSEEGRRVHVVNWWATHPAEQINGVMVTERPFFQLFNLGTDSVETSDVWPPDSLGDVAERLVHVDSVGWDEISTYVDLDRDAYERRIGAALAADNPYGDRVNHLRKILATTRGVFNVGRWLLDEEPFDLLALYVEGTDTVGHRFAQFLDPMLDWVDEADYRAFRDTMARYYELCDHELGRLMGAAPDDVTWIVTADHGFFTGRARPRVPPDDFASGAASWHRLVGVFLALGPHVRPGEVDHLDIYDLGRTLLWLTGAPISDELEGRELVDLMTEEWAAEHPPLRVASYSRLPMPWRRGSTSTSGVVDAARLRELQALGYIERGDATEPPLEEEKATAAFNRAKLAEERGDMEAAVAGYVEAVDLEPRFFKPMLELHRIFRRAEEHDKALYWLARALQTDVPNLPHWLPVELIRQGIRAGRLEQAFELLQAMPPRWQQQPSYLVAQGIAAAQLGLADRALDAFQRALAIDPVNTDALDGLLRIAREDSSVDAGRAIEAAFAAARTDLEALRRLGRLLVRFGQYEAAERCLQAVLESDPTDTAFLRDLARVQQVLGRPDDAAAAMERYLALDPDSAAAWRLYARLLEDAGRAAEATEADRRADALEGSS
jgi:predicted AlkP superfamily phosphohydrolase/phosphomutase/tetratricopeptide (TPR) repeat protein